MIRMNFQRLIQNRRFWSSIPAACMVALISLMGEMSAFPTDVSAYYFINARHGIGAFFIAMTVIVVFPSALNYSLDVRNRYHYSVLGRGKRSEYCLANVLVTAGSAFLTVFLGYWLLYGILRMRYPMIIQSDVEALLEYSKQENGLHPYEYFLIGKTPIMFFVSTFATEALGYSFLACIALVVSARISNPFILLSTPLMAYFGSSYFANRLELPGLFRWDTIMDHGGFFIKLSDKPYFLLGEVFLYFWGLIMICGFVFYLLVRRNESYE